MLKSWSNFSSFLLCLQKLPKSYYGLVHPNKISLYGSILYNGERYFKSNEFSKEMT